MHPIERLRFVARTGPHRPDLLAREAAGALLACADHAELVVSCRRLLDRQPAIGPLWWVASRALVAPDHAESLSESMAALATDSTPGHLADLVDELGASSFAEALALGVDGAYLTRDDAEVVGRAAASQRAVWVIGGVGRALPPRVWEAARARVDRLGPRAGVELVAPDEITMVVGPRGLEPFDDVVAGAECPVAPEILTPLH